MAVTEETGARNILIITDAWKPQVNGVVRVYENLESTLKARGHSVTVVGPADFPRHVKMPGYAEIELTLLPRRRLAKIFDAHPDASIHIGTEGPLGRAARKICWQRNLPFTTFRHTLFADYVAARVGRNLSHKFEKSTWRLSERVIRKFHNAASGIIVSTETHADWLRAHGYRAPAHVMPLGVDTEQFTPGASALFGNVARPLAAYVGRIAVEKNIEAFLQMSWVGSKLVVGGGPDLADLQARYPDVIFAGRQTGLDLRDHYRAANVLVFPSRTDTFGLVMAEALACGVPVARYRNVMGFDDMLKHPELGAADNDLAAAALRALHAPGDAASRHRYIAENYNWEDAATRFLQIMETAAAPAIA